MNSEILKQMVPHILAFFILMAVSFLMFSPSVFQGKVLNQHDNDQARASQAEKIQILKQSGEAINWTNSVFSGMPTFQIHQTIKGNYIKPFYYWALLKQRVSDPYAAVFLSMILTYLLLLVLKVDWRLAIPGAIAFGLSSYQIDIAEAGHSTKMIAYAYLPAILAGAVLAFRGRYLWGGGLFAMAIALQIYANHLQITYYTLLILLIFGVFELVKTIRSADWTHFSKAAGVLIVAGMLGSLSNTSKIWPTYEFSKESTRGNSELKAKENKGSGLDKDYAFEWSVGKMESLTILIPGFSGGGLSQSFKGTQLHNRNFAPIRTQLLQRGMSQSQATKSAEQQIAMNYYWGDQRFVGAPIYFGAIICFLFVLGAFLVPGPSKWWLIVSALLMLSIGWGKNFALNNLWFDYLPLFNKFRSVSMAMQLSQLCFIALGFLGLQRIFDKSVDAGSKNKALLYATGGVGGLCLLLLLGSGMFSFSSPQDANLGELVNLVKEDRMSIMRKDTIRSLILILLSAGLIWAYLNGKVKSMIAGIGIGVLILGDFWTVAKRQLFPEKFEPIQVVETTPATPLPTDQQIMADSDPHFRVADFSRGNPFQSADASYFHKSVGGYSPAKVMVYQELIDRHLLDPSNAMHLYGMLNTKYFIQGQGANSTVTQNPRALGNAWFVNNYRLVPDADAELEALVDFDPATTAVLQEKYAASLEGFTIVPDPAASIQLTSYHPDKMMYQYSAATDQLAVFSEVYYPADKGWNLYLDGEKLEGLTKANYALRAAKLPAGQNRTLEMAFEPRSFLLGEQISKIASLLTILLFLGGMGLYFRDNGMPSADRMDEIEAVAKNKPLQKTKAKKGKKNTSKKRKKSKKTE